MTRSPLADLTPAQRSALAAAQRDPRARALVLGDAAPARPRRALRKAAAPAETLRPVRVGVLVSSRVEPDGAVVARCENLRVNNPCNSRRHWRVVAREGREAKAAVARSLATKAPPAGARWLVTLTREGRGVLDDDNLAATLKHARDAVAAWLGTGDAPDAPVAWRYAQRRAKGYAVEVRVENTK